MAEHDGHLIEFLDGERAKTALVLQQGPKKLQIIDENGRRSSINSGQIICGHSAAANLDSAARTIRETAALIQTKKAEIDQELLWETALDGGSTNPETLSSIYFSTTESTDMAAVFHILLDDTLHYKRKGLLFQIRSKTQVEEQQNAQLKAEENKMSRLNLEKQLKRVSKIRSRNDFLPEDEETLEMLERYLIDVHDNEAGKAMQRLHDEEARSAAFKILETAGRIPEERDPILLVAGLREGFSPDEEGAAAALIPPDFLRQGREDMTALIACSIDDSETKEVDDALTLEPLGKGWRVGIHIADLAAFITPLSDLDILGRKRTISAYMPSGTITMLPPRISCDLASLTEGEVRPAVSLFADFDADYTMTANRFARTLIRVKKRLTYEEADLLMEENPEEPVGHSVRTLYSIAGTLFQKRLESNAFMIDRPEYKIRLEEREITIKKLNNRLKSQTIVQESMILYNSLAGSFAIEQDIPVIFRTQSKPKDKSFPSGRVIEFQPGKMQEIFKQLSPAQLSLEPGPHFGLGVSHYIQASSPLRRYADLVMQRQIAAAAAGDPPPYERDDLWRILAAAEAAEKDIRAVERRAIKYWCLEYIRRQGPEQVYNSTVSRNNGGNCVVELADLPAVGVIRSALQVQQGNPLQVRLFEVAPARDLLVLQPAE